VYAGGAPCFDFQPHDNRHSREHSGRSLWGRGGHQDLNPPRHLMTGAPPSLMAKVCPVVTRISGVPLAYNIGMPIFGASCRSPRNP
jgi:hypothetical protein